MFACPSCERSIDVYFIIEQQGVFLKCMYCGVACPAPAFDLEENKNRADKLVDEPVEYVEALKICERIGQSMPEEIRGPTTRIRRVPRKR
jgi:coenzyme F420-reducing hydrogenase gamma subunit